MGIPNPCNTVVGSLSLASDSEALFVGHRRWSELFPTGQWGRCRGGGKGVEPLPPSEDGGSVPPLRPVDLERAP